MTSISVKREIRNKLKDYMDYDDTMDTAINNLLDEVGDLSKENPPKKGASTIRISDETKRRLIENKLNDKESFSSVLERAFNKL